MRGPAADHIVRDDGWSDLTQLRDPPRIDASALHRWRIGRLRGELIRTGAAACVLVNPISLRYATDYRCYGLFQSHIPTTYAMIGVEGPVVLFNAYASQSLADAGRVGPPINFFDGGFTLRDAAEEFAITVDNFLREIGTSNRRVAVEYVNPGITQSLERAGLDVIDGVEISEHARVIKSEEEIACMEWAIAVAEHGISHVKRALCPGVTELQLWGLLNYTNIANDGDWHEGRMLASGSRINPWLQEASPRQIEAGDLVGFDTDMVGPFGYFADVSRTLFCGPGRPSARQRELYRLAHAEVEHNISILRPGMTFVEFQQSAFQQDEAFHENAYTCLAHAVGMCDEYPRINHGFRGATPYDGTFEPGMVMCLESYVGAVGERDGVKLEEQVLITDTGTRRMTQFPFEADLLA